MVTAPQTDTRRPRWIVIGLIVLGLVVAGVLGIAVGAVIADDDQSDFSSQMEDRCREWMGSGTTNVGTAEWCSSMAGWMEGHMPAGGMPSMMFGNSEFVLDMCRQWMTASPPGADSTDAERWCTGMADWMTGRTGQGPGPMNGPRMDR